MKKRRSVSFAVRQTKGSFSSDFAMDTRLDLQVLITVAIGVSFANPVDFHALSMMGTAAEQTEGCITDLTLTRLSTFASTANFFRGVTPRDGVVCRESSRIASRNAV